MALHCSLRPADRLVYIQAQGSFDLGDTLRLASRLEDLLDEGRLRPGMRILCDFRDAVPLHTYECLIRTCLTFRRHHRRWLAGTAILVDGDYAYGLMRQYTSLALPMGMRVAAFRSCEEAMGWLDLSG